MQSLLLTGNPWVCDCHLRGLRDAVVARPGLAASPATCREPGRLADQTWPVLQVGEFACKPSATVGRAVVRARSGQNASLECAVTGSPTPAVRWVRAGRILANLSTPGLKYQIRQVVRPLGKPKPVTSLDRPLCRRRSDSAEQP